MNYLQEIESEFFRLIGGRSLLSPLDWALADSWIKKEIPLRIVLRAMRETVENYEAKKFKSRIKTLRYFEPEVEKQFAEWLDSQVGKNQETDMKATAAYTVSDETNILEYLVEKLGECNDPGDTPRRAKGEILALLDDVKQKNLSADLIESRLADIRAELEKSLVATVTPDERSTLIAAIETEYGKFKLTDEVMEKVIIRKLREKFNLPELTLYAL